MQHHWFKNCGYLADWMNLAYWQICIVPSSLIKGTVLQFIFIAKKRSLWCYRSLKKQSPSKISFKEMRISHLLMYFCTEIHVCAPRNCGSMQTLPAKSQSLRSLTPQNYGAMQTMLRKIVETQFQGQKNILKFQFLLFFLIIFFKFIVIPEIFTTLWTFF